MQYQVYRQEGILNTQVPGVILSYLSNAVEGLEKRKFGNDMLLGSSWLEGAPKGVMFEVVLKLKSSVNHRHCLILRLYC